MSNIRVSNGTHSATEAPIKRWNGSSWVRASVYRWSGSAWVLIQGATLTTLTYNATGYSTRYWSGNKHYLRSELSSTYCRATYVGYYGDPDLIGYAKFDFPAIYTAFSGKLPQKVEVVATLSNCDVTEGNIAIYPELIYSDASTYDSAIGLGMPFSSFGISVPSITDGVVATIGSSFNPAVNVAQNYVGGRYPFAIGIEIMHNDSMTSATGLTFTNVQLKVTYEA